MTSQAQRAIGVAFVVIGTVLGLYLVSEAWSARDEASVKMHVLELELDHKRSIAANHAQVSTQLDEMREMLGILVLQLPSRFDRPAMEKALREQATLAGIDIPALYMGKEKTKDGFYAELPAEIVVRGSSAHFLKFVDALQHEVTVRVVSALKIEPVDGATTLRATMTLTHFRYIEYGE